MMQDQRKCGSQQTLPSKHLQISFLRMIALNWVVEMKKVPVANFTVECGLLWLMDGAVKNYIRSADYTEMQKSAVIYFSRHFLSTWQQNLTILIVIERVENGHKNKWLCIFMLCIFMLQKWMFVILRNNFCPKNWHHFLYANWIISQTCSWQGIMRFILEQI